MVGALKALEGLCTKEIYNSLCYLLTIKQLSDHPDYVQWTIQRGRIECFEAIKNVITPLFGIQEKRRCPSQRLLKLLRDSVYF